MFKRDEERDTTIYDDIIHNRVGDKIKRKCRRFSLDPEICEFNSIE